MIYVSKEADRRLIEYLSSLDELTLVGPITTVDKAVSCHADLIYCRLGSGGSENVFIGDESKLGPKYPNDCSFCAAIVGGYFVHCLKYTDSTLLNTVKNTKNDIILVDVPQGYTRCNVAVIDDSHVITSDMGICKALENTDIECLLISPRQVQLPGYDYGFIGGTMGRVKDEIIFNGDLSSHSDFERIRDFVIGCGLRFKFFKEYPLTDIGSIVAG